MNGLAANPISGVSIDTRSLTPGDLFFAIKGESSDGHDYVADAFATLLARLNSLNAILRAREILPV
jgi:UDP-N-acetylmuramyl pentapeptide synthase